MLIHPYSFQAEMRSPICDRSIHLKITKARRAVKEEILGDESSGGYYPRNANEGAKLTEKKGVD